MSSKEQMHGTREEGKLGVCLLSRCYTSYHVEVSQALLQPAGREPRAQLPFRPLDIQLCSCVSPQKQLRQGRQ